MIIKKWLCCLCLLCIGITVFGRKTHSQKKIELTIHPNQVFQQIDGFAASDCWSMQFVGKNWPVQKKDSIADWLFSMKVDSLGNPEGIGLSRWRVNIGGGTAEQGDSSYIPSTWRREECFLNADGTYNWDKEKGQQWFLEAAKRRGVKQFLAFCNTPPVYMTKNGKGWSQGGKNYNLKPDAYGRFADFLSTVCAHFKQQGLTFNYLSPVNEPQWGWTTPASQEGTPALNSEIAKLVREISPKLEKNSPKTKIVIPEAGELQFLYRKGSHPERADQLNAFFNPASANYVGNLSNVNPSILGHSYFTTSNPDTLVGVRQQLAKAVKASKEPVNYYQSEFCILESHKDIGGGAHRDLGMATALYVARVIHADLAIGNASEWNWWTAVSPFDYKDGLIYIDLGDKGLVDAADKRSEQLQHNGYFHDSKLMWALGNYSRFVRPGMSRIAVNGNTNIALKDELNQLMVSAYRSADHKRIVLVAVNYGKNAHIVSLKPFVKQQGLSNNMKVSTYLTSKDASLAFSSEKASKIAIPARSIKTIVIDCKNEY